MSRVLVTGGAGYIGSIVVEDLLAAGHAVVVLDDLSQGHADAVMPAAKLVVGDLRDRRLVGGVVTDERIDAVVHMAARSIVPASMTDPGEYYSVNVEGSLSLLGAMAARAVGKIVFSSTAAVYGEAAGELLTETDPVAPTNPYGETKAVVERALDWFARAHGLSATTLRYFNAAGASERNGERHRPETHLIPRILDVAEAIRGGGVAALGVYGDDYPTTDGTCVRDYVHVCDLARAHVLVLDSMDEPGVCRTFNLGGGEGYSVREVVTMVESVTEVTIPLRISPRRAGDPARLVASHDRIRGALGWHPRSSDLRTIVRTAWEFRQRYR